MQAPIPRRASRARRLAGIGAAALLAVPAALIATAPAHAAQPASESFTSATATDWTVPAGVREVTVTAVGGSGGSAAGEHAGVGGLGALVESTLAVEPGDVLTIWAGQAGGNASGSRTASGAGGAGFTAGGNGGYSGGSLSRPGAGGGGSSAVSVDGTVAVVAGGGGGGGGRGSDAGLGLDACRGGAGGNAGAPGQASYTNTPVRGCSTQQGGAAGTDALVAGVNASNVPQIPFINLNASIGGSGGGGAGAGGAGVLNTSGTRTGGGGGGAGGASLGDSVAVASAAGNGSVTLDYAIAYVTTLEVSSSPAPSVIGEDITFTALVTNDETDATPQGDVTFDFAGEIVTVPLEASTTPGVAAAEVVRPGTALGVATVDAAYTPTADAPFAESFDSVDFEVFRGDSLLELEVAPANPPYFDTVRATATVSVVAPAVSTPDGVVVFWYGDDQELGTFPVDPATGQAWVEFPANLIGEHRVFAAYANDSFLYNSDGIATLDTIAAETTTTLKADATKVTKGGAVKFDATVTSDVAKPPLAETGDVMTLAAAPVTPATPVSIAGTVRFTAGERVLGEVALAANGTASFTTTSLAVGTHEVVAEFVSAVPEYAASESAAVAVTVVAPVTPVTPTTPATPATPARIASTGVDGAVLGGAGALAGLLIAAGAFMVIRRKRTHA